MKTTLTALAQQDDPRTLLLRKQIKALLKERRALQLALADLDEFAERCAAAVTAMEPFPRFHCNPASRSAKSPVTAVIDFSDWHIGEVIRGNETEDFNKYNWAIAQERLFNIVSDFIKWVQVQKQIYSIHECRVFAKGDYVSGDIHEELKVTNEFPLPEQSVKAGHLLGEAIRRLSGHFRVVVVDAVGADNHGRLVKKPQAKQKSSNNMSFMVHAMAQSATGRCNNVRWNIATGIKLLSEVNGFKYLIEHGDAVKSWAGFPYYGFGRLIGKEATRRMNTNRGFHYWSIGHWHVPSLIEGRTLVNGSLSGTSEFDSSQGRHADPAQVAHLVHPKHGIFNIVPFKG